MKKRTTARAKTVALKAYIWPSMGFGGIHTSWDHKVGVSFIKGGKEMVVPCSIVVSAADFKKIEGEK